MKYLKSTDRRAFTEGDCFDIEASLGLTIKPADAIDYFLPRLVEHLALGGSFVLVEGFLEKLIAARPRWSTEQRAAVYRAMALIAADPNADYDLHDNAMRSRIKRLK